MRGERVLSEYMSAVKTSGLNQLREGRKLEKGERVSERERGNKRECEQERE